MVEEGNEEVAHNHGVCDGVVVLGDGRCFRPIVHALREDGGHPRVVPNIPLVERQLHGLLTAELVANQIGVADEIANVLVHPGSGCQVGSHVPVLGLEIGVAGNVVDVIVGVTENGPLPLPKGGHPVARGTTGHQLEVGVNPPHRLRGAGGQTSILVSGHRPQLPRSVQFIPEAPHPDIERFVSPVLSALFRPIGSAGDVAVLENIQ